MKPQQQKKKSYLAKAWPHKHHQYHRRVASNILLDMTQDKNEIRGVAEK